MSHTLINACAIAVASTLAFLSLPTAYADEDQFVAESTADLVAEVAPDVGEVVEPVLSGDEVVAQTEDAEVSIPVEATEPIVIESRLPAVEGIPPVEISLPEEVVVDDAKVADDGTVVYASDSDDGATAAVQALEDGSVRVQTVTDSPNGAHEFTYDFGDAAPVLQDDGSVLLVQTIESEVILVEATVGEVEPAWAVDANGDPVDTWYEVTTDGSLVQVIAPDDNATYPIVADPQVGINKTGFVVSFNRSETKKFMAGAGGVAAVAQFVPGWVGMGIKAGTGLILTQASYANATNRCIRLQFLAMYVVPWSSSIYSGGYCR